MTKSKLTIKLFFLKLVYKIICGFVNILLKSNRLVKVKFAVGTLIITLNSTIAYSQNKNNNTKAVYSKNDTLKFNITLEEDSVKEEVIIMCYYGGSPNHKEPFFKGGEKALREFIYKELVYPPKALKKEIEGKVELSYVVDESGRVKDVKVTKGIGAGCDEEAQRVVRSLPKFNAGIKNGRRAEFEKTIEVEFILP